MSKRASEASQTKLRERLIDILLAAPPLMRVLRTARDLRLPDWLVFSGAVYQPVLNHLTGRAPDYGIKDYDLAYFDAADLSYEAEDAVIRRVRAAFDEPLKSVVEVRNQARVHLWFEAKFGEAYMALACAAEALERFTSATFAVGVRLELDDHLHIEAPFGLADLFALRRCPNPRRKTPGFAQTCAGVLRRWPELVIENEPWGFIERNRDLMRKINAGYPPASAPPSIRRVEGRRRHPSGSPAELLGSPPMTGPCGRTPWALAAGCSRLR